MGSASWLALPPRLSFFACATSASQSVSGVMVTSAKANGSKSRRPRRRTMPTAPSRRSTIAVK
jgi:hypothetical protein